MAVQIVPQDNLGDLVGQSFNTGLQGSLQQLANMRLNQMVQQSLQKQQQDRLLSGLGPLFGENASAYSNLPLELLQPLIKQKASEQERVKTSAPGLQQLIPELTPEDAEKISTLTPGIQLEFYRNYLSAPKQTLDQASKNVGINQQPNMLQQLAGQQIQPQSMQQAQQTTFAQPQPQPTRESSLINISPKEIQKTVNEPVSAQELVKPKSVAELVKEGRSLREAKIEAKEARKEAIAEQRLIDKETKAYYDATLAHDEAADMADLRLNKMENLIKKGNLPISTFYKLFDNLEKNVSPTSGAVAGGILGTLAGGSAGTVGAGPVGAVLGSLGGRTLGTAIGAGIGGLISPVASLLKSGQKFTSPDTEQFEKLSMDFIREAKSIFGNRVTDADLNAFLQLIPTLSQTDNGKLAIINNMKMFNKGSQIKADTMKRIIKENKGKRPANLQILVNEQAKPKLDKLAKEFETV